MEYSTTTLIFHTLTDKLFIQKIFLREEVVHVKRDSSFPFSSPSY